MGTVAWEREFDRWLAPFWTALGDTRRRPWGPVYVRGLLGPGERQSVEPLAARVAPDDDAQVHHFVCASCWRPEPLERVLAEKAQPMVGGPDAVLIIDDTGLLKQGKRSVGVARQYAGAGKTTNCQILVSLTLARDEVPVCVALRLFLSADRTWLGLHHHALMPLISFAFLQHLRLREVTRARRRGKMEPARGGPPQPSLPAIRRVLLAHAPAVQLRCPKCNGRLTYQPPA